MADSTNTLQLSDEHKRALASELSDLLTDVEDTNRTYLSKLDTYRKWYQATPQYTKRTDPWDGASNVVVPLIRWQSDAVSSRYINLIFAREDRLWSGYSKNEEHRDLFIPHVPDWINWAASGNEFDMLTPTMAALTEMVPLGRSILALTWQDRMRWLFPPNGGKKPIAVRMGNGPYVEHVPAERVLWQPDRSLQDSEYVIRQSFLSWGDLIRNAQFGIWDREAVEESKGFTDSTSTAAEARRRRLAEDGIQSGSSATDPYDIREAWIEWPLLRKLGITAPTDADVDAPAAPIVVTFCPKSRQILRAIPKPYTIPGWPFYDLTYRPSRETSAPEGLAKMQEHLQRLATTVVNQAVDSMTFQNSILLVTTNPRTAATRFRPNRPLLVDALSELMLPPQNKQIAPDIALLNMALAMSERVSGVSDPNLGREVRLGGHPSPATSTLTLLHESRELLRAGSRILRRELGRLGEDIASLYQDWEQNPQKILSALGQTDGAKVLRWLDPEAPTAAGNLQMQLRPLSDVHNPDVDLQRAVMVDQVVGNYYSRVMQALTVAANPQAPPPVQQAAIQSIQALTRSFSSILESAEVDRLEEMLFKINSGQQSAMNEVTNAVTQRLSDAQSGIRAGNGAGGMGGAGPQPGLPPIPTGYGAPSQGPDGVPLPG